MADLIDGEINQSTHNRLAFFYYYPTIGTKKTINRRFLKK